MFAHASRHSSHLVLSRRLVSSSVWLFVLNVLFCLLMFDELCTLYYVSVCLTPFLWVYMSMCVCVERNHSHMVQLHEIRNCKRKAKSKPNKIAPIAVIDIPYYDLISCKGLWYNCIHNTYQLSFRFKWQFSSHITSPHTLAHWINTKIISKIKCFA